MCVMMFSQIILPALKHFCSGMTLVCLVKNKQTHNCSFLDGVTF